MLSRRVFSTPLAPAFALVAALLLLRILYLAFFCPYCLIEDEAHYWEWSRRLDLSYYSKGPGVAWAIAASTRLLGHSEFAVRLPAVLASAAASIACALLARRLAPRLALAPLYAAVCFQLVPINVVTSILMTIDGPYAACWAVACLAAFAAFHERSRAAWPALALALAIGFLFKYTILLLIPGLLLYSLIERRRLDLHPRWRPLLASAVLLFLLGCSPVLLWNAREGWPTLRHLLGHLGSAAGDMPVPPSSGAPREWSPLWPVVFLASQFALAGPMLVLSILPLLPQRRRAFSPVFSAPRADSRNPDPSTPTGEVFPPYDPAADLLPRSAVLFCWCCAAPILAFYLAVSFFAEPEGNWPMAAFVTLSVLAAIAAARAIPLWRADVARWLALPSAQRPRAGILRAKPESPVQILWHFTLAAGIAVALASLRLDLLAKLPLLSRVIPASRLTAARPMALHASRLLDSLRAGTGLDPFIAAVHYGRASQLAFYLPGQPRVYCFSSRTGGRKNQYDFFPDTSLTDPALAGRPALLSGGDLSQLLTFFRSVTPVGPLDAEWKKGGSTGLRDAFLAFHYLPPTSPPPSRPLPPGTAP